MLDRHIGARLRRARLNNNITLEELQQITKIQMRYLEAIEAENFAALPGTFYVRAFIRQYAEAVGENGDQLVDIFDGKDIPEASRAKAPEPIRVSRQKAHADEHRIVKIFWSKLPMIVLGVAALIIVIVVAAMMLQDNKTNRSITLPSSSVIVDESSTSSSESSSSSTTETSSSTTESSEKPKMNVTFDGESGSTVSMTANEVTAPATLTFQGTNGPCWVGVQVNGAFVYQYTLSAGDTQKMEIPAGTAAVAVTLGASSNVSLSLNDEAVNFNPNSTATVKRIINLTLNYHQ